MSGCSTIGRPRALVRRLQRNPMSVVVRRRRYFETFRVPHVSVQPTATTTTHATTSATFPGCLLDDGVHLLDQSGWTTSMPARRSFGDRGTELTSGHHLNTTRSRREQVSSVIVYNLYISGTSTLIRVVLSQ